MTDNVISLAQERDEQPDQEAIGAICDELLGQRYNGEISAVAVVSLLNGGAIFAACVMTDAQRLELIGAIEQLKADLLSRG